MLHHVMGRRIEEARIFRKEADREDFLSLCQEGSLVTYAWALKELRIWRFVCQLAMRKMGYLGAEVARLFQKICLKCRSTCKFTQKQRPLSHMRGVCELALKFRCDWKGPIGKN
jgi:hypothetical protein